MSLPLPLEQIIEKEADSRFVKLRAWAEECLGFSVEKIEALPKNAGFRRYFRLFLPQNKTVLAVDSPCNETDNNPGFVELSQVFKSLGVRVPHVVAADLTDGFLLVEDLGDNTFEKALQNGDVDHLYQLALDTLISLQKHSKYPALKTLPIFDKTLRHSKLINCQTWFLEKFLKIEIDQAAQTFLNQFFETVISQLESQPMTLIHEDYQSRNLMVLEKDVIALLDFQGAFRGPIAYDAASLLWDCYLEWPMDKVEKWLQYYYDSLCRCGLLEGNGLPVLKTWFYECALQRHLKNTFIFARKYLRDNEALYLDYLPRTAGYVSSALSQIEALKEAHHWWKEVVIPRLNKTLATI